MTLLGRLGASERIGYLLLELRERGLFGARSGLVPLIRAVARIHTPHWFAATTLLIRKVLENSS